ncbi:MAG TPA: RNase A-like domain-containing protein [Labilithrix sp.]|nr:RNase A-like domain-containing protein [Labilithrix sp.]
MSGIDATSRARTSSWDEHYDKPVCKESACHATSARPPMAPAPWAHDGLRIPEAVREYDPSMFANPALLGSAPVAAVAARAPAVASAPDPLPAAADAYHGIHLACLAGELPPSTRTDAASVLHVGHYTLHPAVRVHEDGSKSLLYWTAVNGEAKRAEFIIGPGSLETFKKQVSSFENAGATAYMNGEPNDWQRLSMKAVDDAMRSGPAAALGTLSRAWSAAVRDPSWWGQNLLAVTGAMAGGGAASRAEVAASEETAAANATRARAPAAPGPHTPVVEGGGLRAHEGGPARAHLLDKHVGKTSAELEARFAKSKSLPANSSFYDRAQAEAAVSKTLATNESKVAEWMRNPERRLELEYHPQGPSFPVGTHMARGAEAVPVAGVKVVLLKDATMSCGFRILTGFPIP